MGRVYPPKLVPHIIVADEIKVMGGELDQSKEQVFLLAVRTGPVWTRFTLPLWMGAKLAQDLSRVKADLEKVFGEREQFERN